MKKAAVTILSVLFVLLLFAGAIIGIGLIQKYTPSKTVMSDTEWFGVTGDDVALVFRDELQSAKGLLADGQIYLPLEWVNENLNERFYWDEEGQQLIYTLPDSIVYAGLETLGSSGARLIRESGGQIYLLTGIIAAYTNVRMDAYTDSGAKRIFLDDRWTDIRTAQVEKEGAIRVKGGIKSDILTSVSEGIQVTVIDAMEEWSEVRTMDGFVGYIENKRLGDEQQASQVSSFNEPVYTNISLDEEISMVWHQVTTMDGNETLDRLLAATEGVNVIAPTWFMLTDNEGNYDSLASRTYVETAHAQGLQVWAVVDNFNRGDNVQSEILFSKTDSRKKLIASMIEEVKEYGIDGINMDVEGIKPEAGSHYVQFIRELSVECRREGIVLSIDTYVPSAYTSFYNRAEQGRVADYVVIMAYDEHHAGGEMGTVSSIDYVRSGIENTLKDVPKEKLICGLPFYTRRWLDENGTVSSQALGITASAEWVRANNVQLYWQEELGQYYGELTDGSKKYSIWMEESDSLKRKIDEVRKHNLAGAAYWKLGLESREIWDVVKP